METYKKRIDECTDLESLFLIWKEAHQEEENFYKTFPGENGSVLSREFAMNWTEDGFLSDNTDDIQILFVLKEPNEQNSIDKNCFDNNKGFWIKGNINNFKKAIPRRMYKATGKILGSGISRENWTQKTAVMNLNKRGGYNHTVGEKLLDYVKVYKQFICRQIEIINPKKIVFMLGANDCTRSIIKELNLPNKYSTYYCYHPSYKGKRNSFNDSKFLETIKQLTSP